MPSLSSNFSNQTNALLITGTDTDVGKTVLTTSLVAYWQKYRSNSPLGLIKMIQTGVGDRELYHQLFAAYSTLKIVTPLQYKAPLAPPIAARQEGISVAIEQVWQAFCSLQQQQDFVLIEALGGLGSPLTDELTVADIAGEWRLKTVLVVPVKLGAIAQAVANVALARQHGVKLIGIILSCSQSYTSQQLTELAPIDLIQSLTSVPVLGTIPYLDDCHDLDKLAQVAANLDIELLLP